MTANETQDYVALVHKMDDVTFRHLVNQDRFDQAPAHLAAALRDWSNSERWRAHLVMILQSADSELAKLNLALKKTTSRRSWETTSAAKERALLQKIRTTDRLGEVKLIGAQVQEARRAQRQAERQARTDERVQGYYELRRAIQAHRDETYRRGMEPEDTDLALWAALGPANA